MLDHHPQKAADNAAKRAAEQAKGGHLAALKQRQRVHATFARELNLGLYIAKVINRREIHFLQTNPGG